MVKLDKNWTQDLNLTYSVNETGYYCALALSEYSEFIATAEFINPYGQLPAWEYPKLIVRLFLLLSILKV